MVRKWQTTIEGQVDARTMDGYALRIFCIGFTAKDETQMHIRKTAYAQTSQVRAIRKKMCSIIRKEVISTNVKEFVNKLIPDSIAKDIEKSCASIYPLHNVFIRKVRLNN